jgi:hypothetical protein
MLGSIFSSLYSAIINYFTNFILFFTFHDICNVQYYVYDVLCYTL